VERKQQESVHCLEKEANILESLPPHPNVISFRFSKVYQNYQLMGIEFAKAGTLLQYIRRNRKKEYNDEAAS
jgi:hypothetical protein